MMKTTRNAMDNNKKVRIFFLNIAIMPIRIMPGWAVFPIKIPVLRIEISHKSITVLHVIKHMMELSDVGIPINRTNNKVKLIKAITKSTVVLLKNAKRSLISNLA